MSNRPDRNQLIDEAVDELTHALDFRLEEFIDLHLDELKAALAVKDDDEFNDELYTIQQTVRERVVSNLRAQIKGLIR